jgi:secreted trypsin-like serine protease
MRSILLVAALFAALPSAAILIRADRDDAEYVELASRYPSAIEIAPGLEGVLIAPRWVLTSAHCAMLLQARSRDRPS